ncbi:MAG: alpha/beta fold hydrolase [Candidatus Tectomicrobia bacterium]|uniref:Alpha/beta fold hydrolase n=1 Tax=Tectimicrobiota bacterium TaxID=2528274 RepID=A0A932MMI0_UNCTE|nr:alpha/beta fold hydrolase [Candidatus Tectomicrobia bacterium]
MARTVIEGSEHWARREGADLYLWRKRQKGLRAAKGTVLLAHGSSMASTPSFDLQVKGRSDTSLMDHLARSGFDVWCVDFEGYGRSTKDRPVHAGIERGADDLLAAAKAIRRISGARDFMLYGISSGALRAALFAQRNPRLVRRLVLDAFVWTGEGSPTLAERRKRFAGVAPESRRPVNPAFVESIFTRDHPGTAEKQIVQAFVRAVCELDDSIPNGTYIDMCERLPLVEPEKICVPVLITRGEFDGIASFEDILEFFRRLPNPDKQIAVMPGIAHASLQEKNRMIVFHHIERFFGQPGPVYKG